MTSMFTATVTGTDASSTLEDLGRQRYIKVIKGRDRRDKTYLKHVGLKASDFQPCPHVEPKRGNCAWLLRAKKVRFIVSPRYWDLIRSSYPGAMRSTIKPLHCMHDFDEYSLKAKDRFLQARSCGVRVPADDVPPKATGHYLT